MSHIKVSQELVEAKLCELKAHGHIVIDVTVDQQDIFCMIIYYK